MLFRSYPYRMRILIVQDLFEDHALLRVEIPEGGWKIYDVVPRRVPSLEMTQLKPLVEFDERTMFLYPPQEAAYSHRNKSNALIAGPVDRPRNLADRPAHRSP